jgi:hypothetical protein
MTITPTPDTVIGWQACNVQEGCLTPTDAGSGHRATENLFFLVTSPGIEECEVLARVKLTGRIGPGGSGDPETSWRSDRAEIMELHIRPDLPSLLESLKAHHAVPVAVYEPGEWPDNVKAMDPMGPRRAVSEDAFRGALAALSFGKAGQLRDVMKSGTSGARAVIASLVKVGFDAAESMAGDVPAPDIARALWDSPLAPSMPEATAFVDAVIEHLYPYDQKTIRRGRVFTRPPTAIEELNRNLTMQTRNILQGIL